MDANTAVLFTDPPEAVKIERNAIDNRPSLAISSPGHTVTFDLGGDGLFGLLDRIQTAVFELAEQAGRWEVYNPALDDWEAVSAPQALRFAAEGRHVRHEEQPGVWQHLEGAA